MYVQVFSILFLFPKVDIYKKDARPVLGFVVLRCVAAAAREWQSRYNKRDINKNYKKINQKDKQKLKS